MASPGMPKIAPVMVSPDGGSTVVPSDDAGNSSGDDNSDDFSEGSAKETPKEECKERKGIQYVKSGDTRTRKLIAEKAALHHATAYGDWPVEKTDYAHFELDYVPPPPPEYSGATWSPCPPPGSQAAAEPPRMYSLNRQ